MLSYELWEMVLRYVEASIAVRELEDWLVPREPDILRNPNSADSSVVGAIHLGLAELSDGLRTEDELREFLLEVISAYPVVSDLYLSPPSEIEVRTSSSNEPVLEMVIPTSELMWAAV
jgi:hypothetical protein